MMILMIGGLSYFAVGGALQASGVDEGSSGRDTTASREWQKGKVGIKLVAKSSYNHRSQT